MLPGGLFEQGERLRDWSFAPLTGALEVAIAEAARGQASLPQRITAVLAAALGRLGGGEVGSEAVRSLCVADRQFLMRRLAVTLGQDEDWLSAACTRCGSAFDVPIRQSELPVKPAGDGFPFITAETSHGRLRLRVPTGADQEAIAAVEDPAEARRRLARRCVVDPLPGPLTPKDLEAIDTALEEVAPELVTRVQVPCVDCGHPNELYLDPYLCLSRASTEIFADVHALASHYHWSQREILSLPRERRQLYIDLIDKARGMAG
ncbi:MAG TPA: hypothetical protein VF173_07725 [Thermoanaerobaculia bacterium]|nr:hypothetical protein [Thermoanaerobaculia bacterium]